MLGCNPLFIVYYIFLQFELSQFWLNFYISTETIGALRTQLLLTFNPDIFETLQVFCQCLKMCMEFDCNTPIYFSATLLQSDLVIFGLTSNKAYRYWVSCERN